MRKEIFIPARVKKEIAEAFETSIVTVWSALTFKTNSHLANAIREAALDRGGVVYDGIKK